MGLAGIIRRGGPRSSPTGTATLRTPLGKVPSVYSPPVADVAELVGLAAAGDRSAWDCLVDRFAGLIWSTARGQGLSPADASDVSQTTWLRFAEHLNDLRDASKAASWLVTTARREAIRVARLGSRQVLVDPWSDLDGDPEGDELDASLLERERDLVIQQAMALLPQRCRQLITVLIADPPLPYAEVGRRMDMPVGSIGPTRARCLEHLRRLMAEVEADPSTLAAAREGSTQ